MVHMIFRRGAIGLTVPKDSGIMYIKLHVREKTMLMTNRDDLHKNTMITLRRDQKRERLSPKTRKLVVTIVSIFVCLSVAVCVIVPTIYEHGILNVHSLKNAKEGQIRVACVGDSITYGCMVSNWTRNNYPTQLGRMLGSGYCVNNFGYSGRAAMFSADHPYVGETLYRQSVEFQPNIVVIMLGSNDTRTKNWRGVEDYVADYKAVIASYLRLESVEQIYIMSPPPAFRVHGKNPYNINPELLETVVRDAVVDIAEELGLNYIDLYGLFEGKKNLFVDGAHPTAEGAKMIAQTVYASLTENSESDSL